jgi:hypothetical protein
MLKCKRKSRMAVLFLCGMIAGVSAHAANQGLYVSGQMGWGDVHQRNISRGNMNNLIGNALGTTDFTLNTYNPSVSDSTGIAGRGALGWQYGNNWALELGYSKFSNVQTNVHSTLTDNTTGLPATAYEKSNFETWAVDFVGKAILPLKYNFSVYGQLGLAYLWGWPNEKVTVTEAGIPVTTGNNDHETKWYPTFGVGAAYDFTPQMQGVLTWTRIQQVGNSANFVFTTDLIAIGLSMHFDTW